MKGRVGLSWKEYLLLLLWAFFLFTLFYMAGYPTPEPMTIERAVMLANVGLVALTTAVPMDSKYVNGWSWGPDSSVIVASDGEDIWAFTIDGVD